MSNRVKIVILIVLTVFVIIFVVMWKFNMIPKKSYFAEDFNIDLIKSNIDYDNDGIDDYSDILEGAKKEVIVKPKYVSKYYQGGYPPDTEGVCTDVIWRAFKNAGYDLKQMMDNDILLRKELYTAIYESDPNIDFRRVRNLKVFFENNLSILTNNPYEIEEWMPGDIVIFGYTHIAIISDKRNKNGISYIIHNAGQPNRDEDALIYWYKSKKITGHYRLKQK